MRCAIGIPVYKQIPDALEKVSFARCVRVLGHRPIYLVTHPELDCSEYERIATQAGVKLQKKLFEASFFKSVEDYNRLMLDKRFYLSFADYDYLLTYQLDAYVFSDELDDWCSRGYDYVGAPWFDYFKNAETGGLFTVGNGGFSLRRVEYFTSLLTSRKGLFSFSKMPADKGFVAHLKFLLGGYNRIGSLVGRNTLNEDHFFCIFLKDSKYAPHIPEPEEAAAFAFEQSPSYLYRLIGNRLPMGCHAFEKFEYHTFWQDKIK